MAAASELDIIHNQINEGLGAFRHLFESTRAELGIAASQDVVQVVFSTVVIAGASSFLWLNISANIVVAKNLVLDLILALQNQPIVRTLPSQKRSCESPRRSIYSPLNAGLVPSAYFYCTGQKAHAG